MTPTEVVETIARLRRKMPRNSLAMALCDAAEDMLLHAQSKKTPLTRAEIQKNYRIRQKQQQSGL